MPTWDIRRVIMSGDIDLRTGPASQHPLPTAATWYLNKTCGASLVSLTPSSVHARLSWSVVTFDVMTWTETRQGDDVLTESVNIADWRRPATARVVSARTPDHQRGVCRICETNRKELRHCAKQINSCARFSPGAKLIGDCRLLLTMSRRSSRYVLRNVLRTLTKYFI